MGTLGYSARAPSEGNVEGLVKYRDRCLQLFTLAHAHVCITQQMENIMMLMMSERGKKERHRRARGNADSPNAESRAALSSCYFTSLSNKISAECFNFADATDVGARFTGRLCFYTPPHPTTTTDLPRPR